MNCKQGDLAVVVKSSCVENIGKVVRCIRPASGREKWEAWFFTRIDDDFWVTDVSLKIRFIYDKSPAGAVKLAMDSALRPIRDNDGEDETLQWAPVPSKELAHD